MRYRCLSVQNDSLYGLNQKSINIVCYASRNTAYPHLLKLPQQFNKLRFPNPTILLDGCERNAAVRLFRDTAQLLFRLFAVLGGIDTVQQLGKRNRVKVHHMQPVEKLMLLIFYLRAELDKLTFPIFSLGQFSDF